MSGLRIRELVRKEFIQLFRDKKNRPLLIIAPLVQLIVFGYVVTTDVRDIRVGLFDERVLWKWQRRQERLSSLHHRAPRRYAG